MLIVQGVTVTYGARTVLDRVSMVVETGETVALLGPSGSGKSTLLRVIAGLALADRGQIAWGDDDLTHVPAHRRRIGMVFQDEQLFPHLRVADNVAFGLRMTGVSKPARLDRVGELLELVGLGGYETRQVTDLSGGEAKRVALARALAPQPRVLLLDEPLTGLDRDLHDRLADELRRILQATSTTAIHVTHDPDEAARVADRTVTLTELAGARPTIHPRTMPVDPGPRRADAHRFPPPAGPRSSAPRPRRSSADADSGHASGAATDRPIERIPQR